MKQTHNKNYRLGLWAVMILLLGLHGCAGHYLKIAANTNDTFEVKRLLAHHPGIGLKSKQLALLSAINLGNIDAAKALIEHGADVNYKDAEPTPLINALMRGRENIVELLIANGADVNARAANGDTPLIFAANNAGVLAALLIAKGAEVNAGNENGDTALIYAASNGNLKLAELLIANGADVKVKNKKGDTPVSLAGKKANHEVEEFLIFNNSGAGKAQLDNLLARLILRMAPPTEWNFDTKTQKAVPKDWDPESSQEAVMPKLVKLLAMGADPNALRIKGYSQASHTAMKSKDLQMEVYAPGSPGKIVPFTEEGQTLLDFCREIKLMRACDALVKYGAK